MYFAELAGQRHNIKFNSIAIQWTRCYIETTLLAQRGMTIQTYIFSLKFLIIF